MSNKNINEMKNVLEKEIDGLISGGLSGGFQFDEEQAQYLQELQDTMLYIFEEQEREIDALNQAISFAKFHSEVKDLANSELKDQRLMNNKEQYVKVSDILNYCRESAKSNRELANKCIKSVGKGESEISSLGGAAYFLEQARMYDFDIPNMIRSLNFKEGDSILETPLEALGLSTRGYNSLKRANIKTLGDITKLYLFELQSIRNLGSKQVDEVFHTLRKYGVSLKGEME